MPLAGRLAWVMADMKERSVAAERSKAEASKLAEVVHREKVKEPISTRLKKVLMKLVSNTATCPHGGTSCVH